MPLITASSYTGYRRPPVPKTMPSYDYAIHHTSPVPMTMPSHATRCNDNAIRYHHFYQTIFLTASPSQELSLITASNDFIRRRLQNCEPQEINTDKYVIMVHSLAAILDRQKNVCFSLEPLHRLMRNFKYIIHSPRGKRFQNNDIIGHMVWQPYGIEGFKNIFL